MPRCLIPFCKNYQLRKDSNVNFFKMTEQRYDAWMRALGRDPRKEQLSMENLLCSEHFKPEDIIIRSGKRCKLKANAVPCLKLTARDNTVYPAIKEEPKVIYIEDFPFIDEPSSQTSSTSLELLPGPSTSFEVVEDNQTIKIESSANIEAQPDPSTACEVIEDNQTIKIERMTEQRYDPWMKALGRDPTTERISMENHFCSEHFKPEDIIIKPGKQCKLKKDAVPCLKLTARDNKVYSTFEEKVNLKFLPSFHEHKHEPFQPSIDPLSTSPSSSSFQEDDHHILDDEGLNGTSPENTSEYIRSYHNYNICPRKQTMVLQSVIKKNKELQKNVKTMKQRIQRLSKRLCTLKGVVKELKKNALNSDDAIC